MIDHNLFDTHHWPVELFRLQIDHHNVEISKPATSILFQVGQLLSRTNAVDKLDFSSFLVENVNLLTIITSGYCLVILAIYILSKQRDRRFSLGDLFVIVRNGLSVIRGVSSSISFKFKFVFCTLSCFLFFNLNLLRGLIKTSKIIVNTDEFIDSIDKLNKTTKTLIVFNDMKTVLNHVLNRKRDDIVCLNGNTNFLEFYSMVLHGGLNSFVYFMEKVVFLIITNGFSFLIEPTHHIRFIKSSSYYEAMRALIVRKNLELIEKNFIHRR